MQVSSVAPLSRSTALIFAIVPAAAASVIGSAATLPNIPGWYMSLIKPGFTPPNWLFGPVWTALYIIMAWTCYRVMRKDDGATRRREMTAYLLQAVLNGLWSVGFFGLNHPGLGLIIIAPLWGAIFWTTVLFWQRDLLSGLLFLPYLAWVPFAIALNASIWSLNP